MSFPTAMGFTADLLQFVVAGYALRLNRLFGTARVGWSLFCAFALLALLHLIQSMVPFNSAPFGIKVELMYAIIALLLLTGMVHMEALLKERLRIAREEQQMRAELESQVKRKTAYLTKTIEELQREMDERRRMEAEVEKSHAQLVVASQHVEMAEIANSVFRSMDKMLKSVNVSTNLVSDQMGQSKIVNVVHIGALLREHAADLGGFMTRDPRGQKLPLYIAQLAEHLAEEQGILSKELESIRKNIEEIIVLQQNYAQLAGVADMLEVTRRTNSTLSWEDTEFLVASESGIHQFQAGGGNGNLQVAK